MQGLVIWVWIAVKPERMILVQDLVIKDWIAIKPKRHGDGRFLKDSDGFQIAFQVWFSCDKSIDFVVITVW